MKYLVLAVSMILAIIAQILLKSGVSSGQLLPNPVSIIKTLFSPMVFMGLALYGLSAILWLFVLQKFPLSVAYPSLAATYVIVVLISAMFLNEALSWAKLLGVILIVGGVICLNR